MAKFKKGDRVRCVFPDQYGKQNFSIGDTALVVEGKPNCALFVVEGEGIMHEDKWELATPEHIPDTVTIGGVEYVRKPEREHVWAWGQWARVDANHQYIPNEKVFVTGPIKANGWVPISHPKGGSLNYTDGLCPTDLTYISDATIPE